MYRIQNQYGRFLSFRSTLKNYNWICYTNKLCESWNTTNLIEAEIVATNIKEKTKLNVKIVTVT